MIVKESLLRDILRLIIWYPFRWIVYLLPFPVVLLIYRGMGNIHYFLSKGKRKVIGENVKRALKTEMTDKKLSGIVRKIIQTHYMDRLIIFLFPKLNEKNICKVVAVEGLEHLDSALSRNKGAILVHAHFGPAQLSLCALGYRDYKMNQLGFRTSENLSFIGRTVQTRIRLNIEENEIPCKMIYVNQFMRPAFNAMKNNEVLMMAGDASGGNRHIGKRVEVDFLGNNMLLPVGWVSLAQKTGAQVLPLSLYPDDWRRYKVVIHRPINIESVSTHDMVKDVSKFVEILENDIMRFPEQWHFWDEFHEGNLLTTNNIRETKHKSND